MRSCVSSARLLITPLAVVSSHLWVSMAHPKELDRQVIQRRAVKVLARMGYIVQPFPRGRM